MNYQSLIASIQAAIYNNGAELITGNILQGVLLDMVNALDSAGATYGGTITPASAAPADLDQPTVYLAIEAGTYTNYLDSGGNPIVTTGPALIMYEGGNTLYFSKTDLPSGGSGATVITNDGSEGDSVAIRLTDNGSFRRSFRIDLTTPTNTGSDDKVAIGTLIVEANNIISGVQHHGYYYGDDLGDILAEVAIYQDDIDQDTFYLMLQNESDLDSVTFAITPLDGGEVDAFVTNAADDHTKVADATITPVGSGGGDGKIGVISQTQTWTTEPVLNKPGVYQMSNHTLGIIPHAFIDLAESIGATFNPNGYQPGVGYFELNGLTDLSYEEMIDVYNLVGVVQNFASWGGTALRALKKCPRTLPPVSNRANTQYAFNYAFRVATQGVEKTYIESIGIGTESTDLLISSGFSEMLYNATYLRYFGVNGALKPNSSAASFSLAFQNCHSLTSVRIYGLCQNIDFAGTYYKPAIDLASIVFMVENAANTAAITIKVSPTTYGYCQADTTEYTYQGNTYTGILALATAHNISIGQV